MHEAYIQSVGGPVVRAVTEAPFQLLEAVHVGEQDLFDLSESNMQMVRGRRVAMIFQNAMTEQT